LNLESEKLTSLFAGKTGCGILLRKGLEELEVLHSGSGMSKTYGLEEMVREERAHAPMILRSD
jgi:hypothetical protein